MRDANIHTARRALVEHRRRLLHRAKQALDEERALLETREPDWEDQAANETAARFLSRLSETELMQLRRVQSALDRIDRGTYGACLTCGSPISRARLAVVPEAERCGNCTNSH